MRLKRTYRCLDCGARFSHVAADATSAEPECPGCSAAVRPPPDRVAAPMIIGTRSKAVDEAWKIASEDYGLSDMNDGGKEGDAAFKPPPQPKVDPRTITHPTMLWGGASPSTAQPMPGQANMMAAGRGAMAVANAEGRNPMQMLHKQRPKLQAIPVNRGG